MWIIIRAQGHKLWLYRNHIFHFFVMGIFACGAPFFLISLGEIYITSSLAAIINSTTPIFTAMLAHFFISGDRINFNKGVGIFAGVLGILVIFLPEIGNKEVNIFGASLVFLAAISYAIGMVYSKKHFSGVPSIVCATAQLLAASALMWPIALVVEQPYLLKAPSMVAVGGICGLGILGTATAFPVFYYIGKIAGPIALSTSALLFPVIGVFLGVLILGETVTLNAYVGSAMILSGLAIANGLIKIRRPKLPEYKKAQ